MKKGIILATALMIVGFVAQAQNYMVVNTEKVFTANEVYVAAMASLDKQAEQYQKTIDDAYAEVEKMYNDYQAQKSYLAQTSRQAREEAIIKRENEIIDYQEQVFGQEGEMMKKRIELIKPIQDKVFTAIENYAKANEYELVIDIASNPTIIYYAPTADKTEEIIKLTK